MSHGDVTVSVVIPLHNRRHYIRRAVDSVLGQTYRDFELIVVDDGSTDGSGDLVREYDDPRLRLVTQANAGECAARNRGVAEARAEWIALLDSDDEWLPRFLERTMEMVQAKPGLAAIFTNMFTSGERDDLFLTRPHPGGVVSDYFEFFVENDGRAMSSSSSVVHKQTLLDAGGFPDGVPHGGDADTWMRLAWLGQTAYVPAALAVWHTEADARVMKVLAPKCVNARMVSIATYEGWKAEGRIPEAYRESSEKMLQRMCLAQVRIMVDAGDTAGARRFMRSKCVPKLCGRGKYWSAYARSLVPKPLLLLRGRLLSVCRKMRKRFLVAPR